MKMSYERVNNNQCVGLSPHKAVPDEWINSENKICHITSSSPESLNFSINILVIAIFTILVIRGLYQWIIKYKLQYLFRISCIIFICQSLVLLFNITEQSLFVQAISFLIPSWQNSEVTFFFNRKSLWFLSTAFCLIMGVVRYHWALPTNVIKDSMSTGFNYLENAAKSRRLTVRDLASKMMRHKESADLNPVYVNGWIPLIDSRSVGKGKAESVIAVGYKFCVYRGEDGQIFVTDAYCPHLGADLSAGGRIIGNCIECPFHAWQFDGKTGKCTKIPYTQKIPDTANIKVWKSCERNGYVFVWHHAENEPPTWELPSVPEIENGQWVYRGRSELTVHCHIQDIPENASDVFHIPEVHSRFVCFGQDTPKTEWIKHDFDAKWFLDGKESHIAREQIVQRLLIFGYEVPYFTVNIDVQQIGPASVYIFMDTVFGKGVFLHYVTTEGPMLQRVIHEFYTEPRFKPTPASFFIWAEAALIESDIAVWNHKKFLRHPVLVKEDKCILKFRRWYSQFYSEHSPTLKDLRQKTLDW